MIPRPAARGNPHPRQQNEPRTCISEIQRNRHFGIRWADGRGWLPKPLIVCIDPPRWGHVAEWLRSGLQNRLLRFNSGRGLHNRISAFHRTFDSRAQDGVAGDRFGSDGLRMAKRAVGPASTLNNAQITTLCLALRRRRSSLPETKSAARREHCRWPLWAPGLVTHCTSASELSACSPPRELAQQRCAQRPANARTQLHSSRPPHRGRTVANFFWFRIEQVARIVQIRRSRLEWLLDSSIPRRGT